MRPSALVLVVAIGLAPAASIAEDRPARVRGPGEATACDADRAKVVMGRRYSNLIASRARSLAGARTLRKIEPGHVYTMEFRAERLNLEVNRRGVVTGIRCG